MRRQQVVRGPAWGPSSIFASTPTALPSLPLPPPHPPPSTHAAQRTEGELNASLCIRYFFPGFRRHDLLFLQTGKRNELRSSNAAAGMPCARCMQPPELRAPASAPGPPAPRSSSQAPGHHLDWVSIFIHLHQCIQCLVASVGPLLRQRRKHRRSLRPVVAAWVRLVLVQLCAGANLPAREPGPALRGVRGM